MSRKYQKSKVIRNSFTERTKIRGQAKAQAREVQLPLDVESLVEMSRTALSSFAAEVGLIVAQRLLEDEATQFCGERHERQTKREMTRFGHSRGYVTLASQKGRIHKPRVRYVKKDGEVELERYRLLQSPDAMPQAALNQLVNGVSTRRYEHVVELVEKVMV
ncbi:MAG: hypothetical protein FJ295_06900 [Planctomycetes bacterium]|nr:hypothetical protein [Planctomycetota bacterium]